MLDWQLCQICYPLEIKLLLLLLLLFTVFMCKDFIKIKVFPLNFAELNA